MFGSWEDGTIVLLLRYSTGFIGIIFIVLKIAAQSLVKAIKKASVDPLELLPGDFVVVTQALNDIAGIVDFSEKIDDNHTALSLHTSSGLRTLKISNQNFVHLLKEGKLLNLREHNTYERDLEDMSEKPRDNGHMARPQFSPADIEKSNLPTSKISLNLRKSKE